MNWTQGEVKHTSNGSRATQTTLEMMGQTKKQVKGHKDDADSIELRIPEEHKLQGARLVIMTQNLAYDWITQLKKLRPITRKGQENLKDTLDALEDLGSPRPTEQKLWKDLKYSKRRNNIGDWFWKLIHGRLRSGAYWKNFPGYEETVYCKHCQNLETMNHILFSCTTEGREHIWEMAEKLYELPMKTNNRLSWTVPSKALLRGFSSLKLRENITNRQKKDTN